MSIQDFRTVDPDASLETDLCIIGSGFAGWTIAEELRDSGLQILIVESSGTEPEPESYALSEFECVGVPLWRDGWARILGGTSEIWSGRCIPLDDDDYEPHRFTLSSPIGCARAGTTRRHSSIPVIRAVPRAWRAMRDTASSMRTARSMVSHISTWRVPDRGSREPDADDRCPHHSSRVAESLAEQGCPRARPQPPRVRAMVSRRRR